MLSNSKFASVLKNAVKAKQLTLSITTNNFIEKYHFKNVEFDSSELSSGKQSVTTEIANYCKVFVAKKMKTKDENLLAFIRNYTEYNVSDEIDDEISEDISITKPIASNFKGEY